jgi:hypothetical protein
MAEAARRGKASEQSMSTWKRQFLEGGKAGLSASARQAHSDVRESCATHALKSPLLTVPEPSPSRKPRREIPQERGFSDDAPGGIRTLATALKGP